MMSLDTLLEHLDAGQPLVTGTEAFDCMHGYSYEAMRLTAELNNAFQGLLPLPGSFMQCLLLFPGSGRDQHR